MSKKNNKTYPIILPLNVGDAVTKGTKINLDVMTDDKQLLEVTVEVSSIKAIQHSAETGVHVELMVKTLSQKPKEHEEVQAEKEVPVVQG
jgi:hypothetical protein